MSTRAFGFIWAAFGFVAAVAVGVLTGELLMDYGRRRGWL